MKVSLLRRKAHSRLDKVSKNISSRCPCLSNLTKTPGIAVAAYNLGCFAGSVPTIWIGNYLGRRKTIFLGSAIMVVGAILQAAAYDLTQLIIGRILTGFGKQMTFCGVDYDDDANEGRQRNQYFNRPNLAI